MVNLVFKPLVSELLLFKSLPRRHFQVTVELSTGKLKAFPSRSVPSPPQQSSTKHCITVDVTLNPPVNLLLHPHHIHQHNPQMLRHSGWEPILHTWRCWVSSWPLHTLLQLAPVLAEGHSLVTAWWANRITSSAKSGDAILIPPPCTLRSCPWILQTGLEMKPWILVCWGSRCHFLFGISRSRWLAAGALKSRLQNRFSQTGLIYLLFICYLFTCGKPSDRQSSGVSPDALWWQMISLSYVLDDLTTSHRRLTCHPGENISLFSLSHESQRV